MTAVVLCPGPSLARLTAAPAADLTIGVNRATTAFACDVWAALDYPLIRDQHAAVIGTPALLTRAQTWTDIGRHLPLALAGTADALRGAFPVAGCAWDRFTATTAIVYAASAGATRIDVYGADMAGTAGFDAADAGENRDAGRWGAERVIFDRLTDVLSGRGVSVNRIGYGIA